MTPIPPCLKKGRLPPRLLKAATVNAALADVNRLRIICMLKRGERCVCEIWKALGLSQNLASHHLRILKGCGLIRSRKDGLRVFYSLNNKALKDYLSTMGMITAI